MSTLRLQHTHNNHNNHNNPNPTCLSLPPLQINHVPIFLLLALLTKNRYYPTQSYYHVVALCVYPVKSCPGIPQESLTLTKSHGIKYDRGFVVLKLKKGSLPDDAKASPGTALEVVTMRECPFMSKVGVTLYAGERPAVRVAYGGREARFLYEPDEAERFDVELFRNKMTLQIVEGTRGLFPEDSSMVVARVLRGVACREDTKWRDCYPGGYGAGAVDGSQALVVFTSALEDLNEGASREIPVDRFRPNIVLAGRGAAQRWEEDFVRELAFPGLGLSVNKPCHRCVLSTVDLDTGKFDKKMEPLKTLKKHRLIKKDGRFGDSPAFGLNCTAQGEGGEVRRGEEATATKGMSRRVNWDNVSMYMR